MKLVHVLLLSLSVLGVRAAFPDSVNLTLVHLQVLHRHGDRAPVLPVIENDPFRFESYWPMGFEELTSQGRARMYQLGVYLRKRYHEYLGDKFSPREVYARSSSIDRCLESAQLVLAGSYPPNSSEWQWHYNGAPLPLAQIWQPIPIVSFIPADDDTVLRMRKPCPTFDDLKQDFFLNDPKMIQLLNEHKPTIDELSSLTGTNMTNVRQLDKFHENILIEHFHGYYWSDHFPQLSREREMQITDELEVFSFARWNNEFRLSQWAKRNRAGAVLTLIGENFKNRFSIRDLQFPQKLIVLSSHDTKVVAVMEALNVWNEILMPYGAALIFELYQQNITQFYVKIEYLNTTDALLDPAQTPRTYSLELPECFNQSTEELGPAFCPLEQFLRIVEPLRMTQADIESDCGIDSSLDDVSYMSTVNMVLLLANLAIFFILLLLLMYFCTKLNKKPGYQQLE